MTCIIFYQKTVLNAKKALIKTIVPINEFDGNTIDSNGNKRLFLKKTELKNSFTLRTLIFN